MANSFDEEREPLEIGSVAQLANHIVWRLPGCTDEAVRRALQSSYSDFCRASCALTATRCVEVGDCERVCEILVAPSRADRFVDCVKSVVCNGRELTQGREYSIRDGRIILRHPYERCRFIITTVEQPVDGSESAPSWFLKKYGTAIESGALARLMSMTGKAWSDPAQAKVEACSFNDYITQAKLAYYRGEMTNGASTVSMSVCESGLGGLL